MSIPFSIEIKLLFQSQLYSVRPYLVVHNMTLMSAMIHNNSFPGIHQVMLEYGWDQASNLPSREIIGFWRSNRLGILKQLFQWQLQCQFSFIVSLQFSRIYLNYFPFYPCTWAFSVSMALSTVAATPCVRIPVLATGLLLCDPAVQLNQCSIAVSMLKQVLGGHSSAVYSNMRITGQLLAVHYLSV